MIDRDAPPAVHAQGILDSIEANPESFDMRHWMKGVMHLYPEEAPSCETTLCAAGWAVHNAGYTLSIQGKYSHGGAMAVDDKLHLHEVSVVARKLLGLKRAYSAYLFLDMGDSEAKTVLRDIAKGMDPNHAVKLEMERLGWQA